MYFFEENWQRKVNNIIGKIKNKKSYIEMEREYQELELELEIKSKGIDTVIFACTDLSLIKTDNFSDLRIIDSSKELAKRMIQEYLKD